VGAAAPITLLVRSSDLALAEAQRSSCHRRATPHVHHEHPCPRHRGGRTATRDAACGAMTDRTIPVIFWTVMALLVVSLLVLVLAS